MKQREIKFKAWSPNRNGFVKNCYPIGTSRDIIIKLCGVGEGEDVNDTEDDGLVLLQYTGLKDKNGKEIYEGDIIRHESGNHLCEVVFEEGCFCMRYFAGLDTGMTRRIGFSATYCEIIGNIYENPELLNP